MDNKSDSRTRMCRLCLRVYSNEQLVEIFNDGSVDDQAIFEAVFVQPVPEDPATRICVHCRHIVLLINTFKQACMQTNLLLKNSSYQLESDAWSILTEIDIFKQAAELVERHQKDIELISKKDDFDEDVIIYDPEVSPSHLVSESVDLISDEAEKMFNEEFEPAEQIVEIGYIDNNEGHCSYDVPDKDTGPITLDSQAKDENIKEKNSVDCITINTSNNYTEGSTLEPKERILDIDNSDSKLVNREKLVCSTCGELVSQQGLEGHLNRHLGVQPFACDIEGCKAKLHSKFALQQHRSRHKSTSQFYNCEVCGKRIKGTAYWLLHQKIHTEEPRFSCDICGKKFRRKSKLKLHATVHSGVADYPCEICGKFFTIKHNLAAHYRLHMKNGTYPPGFRPTLISDDSKFENTHVC